MEKRKEIDLAQAQEISKHLITDIINQAVLRLNEDIKLNKQMKREFHTHSLSLSLPLALVCFNCLFGILRIQKILTFSHQLLLSVLL